VAKFDKPIKISYISKEILLLFLRDMRSDYSPQTSAILDLTYSEKPGDFKGLDTAEVFETCSTFQVAITV